MAWLPVLGVLVVLVAVLGVAGRCEVEMYLN
jgi:hypothetical protein